MVSPEDGKGKVRLLICQKRNGLFSGQKDDLQRNKLKKLRLGLERTVMVPDQGSKTNNLRDELFLLPLN